MPWVRIEARLFLFCRQVVNDDTLARWARFDTFSLWLCIVVRSSVRQRTRTPLRKALLLFSAYNSDKTGE
jgi:hypothetical protein